MAEENEVVTEEIRDAGTINISNDVVSIVASLAASGVKGVYAMVSSISGGIAELLGKKTMAKGVKVSVTNKEVTLDLSIIVEYGAKIPDVAWEIQEKVKDEVEAMTGLKVVAVNVSVEGVNVPKPDGEKIPPQDISGNDSDAENTEAAEDSTAETAKEAPECDCCAAAETDPCESKNEDAAVEDVITEDAPADEAVEDETAETAEAPEAE